MQRPDVLHDTLPISASAVCRRKYVGIEHPKPLHLNNERADLHANHSLMESRMRTEGINGGLHILRVQTNQSAQTVRIALCRKNTGDLPKILEDRLSLRISGTAFCRHCEILCALNRKTEELLHPFLFHTAFPSQIFSAYSILHRRGHKVDLLIRQARIDAEPERVIHDAVRLLERAHDAVALA